MKRGFGVLSVVLAAVVGIAVVWVGNHFGFWWVTMLVGLAIGLFLGKVRAALVAATLAGVGGWGLDLLWQSFHADIGGAASVVAGIMGFGTSKGFIVILLTLALALLLSLAGCWVGTALRRTGLELRRYGSSHANPHAVATEAASPQANAIVPTEATPVQASEG